MKSAHFTFIGKQRTLRGKVILNDDGKISVSLSDGRMASYAMRYQAKKYAEKIATDGFIDPTITNFEEIVTNYNLLEILYKETESLKIQYLEKCTKYAQQKFESASKLTQLSIPDLFTKFDIPFTMVDGKLVQAEDLYTNPLHRGKPHIMSKELNNARAIVYQSEKIYVAKAIKLAEQHYKSSIIKLARRIETKGLDISKLKTETSHIGVNIETILTDGNLTVRAWTIIAEGPIQQPHYRYLVK